MKNIFKNNFVRMVTALVVVGVLSGTALVFIHIYTEQKIKHNQNVATGEALLRIFPDMDKSIVLKRITDIHKNHVVVEDKNMKVLGYAFTAEGNGYQGTIKLLVGVTPDLSKLVGFEVLESQETPGLGAEIAGEKFRKQFEGLTIAHVIEYVKNEKPTQPYQIEAITGATISSRAVVNILNGRIEEVRKFIKKQ